MFCKWCGLESESSDICSWCHKPFSTAAAAKLATAPPPVAEPPPAPVSVPAPASVQVEMREVAPPASAAAPPPVAPTKVEPTPRPTVVPPEEPVEAKPTPLAAKSVEDDPDALPIVRRAQPAPTSAPTPTPAAAPPVAEPIAAKTAPLVVEPVKDDPDALPIVRRAQPAPAQPPPPSVPRQTGDARSPMEAIPIRRSGPGSSPPTIIPISRPAQPTAPPPAETPAPQAPAPTVMPPPSAPRTAVPAAQTPATPVAETSAPAIVGRTEGAPRPTVVPQEEAVEAKPAPLVEGRIQDDPDALPMVRRPQPADSGAPARPPTTPSTATATMPPAGARIWYCRWCGLESEAPDLCTWCHKDLRNVPTIQHKITAPRYPNVKHGPVRQPITRPAAPDPDRTVQLDGNGATAPAAPAVPQLGTFQAQQSKYYSNQVVDPISGAHYDADTGTTTDTPVAPREVEEINLPRQTAVYGISLFIMAGVASALGAFLPQLASWYLILLFVPNLLGGMMMPLLRVVPFGEDDSGDVPWLIALTLILGPFVGFMLYGIICVIKNDTNPAIIGIFLTYLIIRVLVDATTNHSLDHMLPFAELSPTSFAAQWMTFATLCGWYAAGMFHPTDE